MRSLWLSRTHHWAAFVTLQAQYSLLVRELERVPLCRDEGLGILPWSPLAGGFLTGKRRNTRQGSGSSRYGPRVAAAPSDARRLVITSTCTSASAPGITPRCRSVSASPRDRLVIIRPRC